jgi:hypothetical protein
MCGSIIQLLSCIGVNVTHHQVDFILCKKSK